MIYSRTAEFLQKSANIDEIAEQNVILFQKVGKNLCITNPVPY